MGVFERKTQRKIYRPFCDRGEWHIRWNQEQYVIYDDLDVFKNSVFDGWVMFFVRIAPTQFVKSSNLSQVVEVANKDGLASVGLNR